MANGFGSLWIGASGIQSASNGLNTTANNLSNVNTTGYVREQVVYETRNFNTYDTKASISDSRYGLGVEVGTIVHARDIFLDKAYRTESGRFSFYSATSEAVQEVYTYLQESDGERFEAAIADFYEAFAEFAKDPSDTVNQNLVLQKASLFLSRGAAVEKGFEDYQTIINQKINDDVDRINEIGKEIIDLNKRIQAIEASHVEQAMDLRDTRDLLIDELSSLCRISYREENTGILHVEIEGVEFINEVGFNAIGITTDLMTGYSLPYWTHLSSTKEGEELYYPVFSLDNISAEKGSDLGEIKALLLARGDHKSSYIEYMGVTADYYENGIGNSVMMNSEAELDTLVHELVTKINDLFSPIDEAGKVYGTDASGYASANKFVTGLTYENGTAVTDDTKIYLVTADGTTITSNKRVCDVYNADVGSDGELPPREMFVRNGTDRYTETLVFIKDAQGNQLYDQDGNALSETIYLYNEEQVTYTDDQGRNFTVNVSDYVYHDTDRILDTANAYTLKNISVNEDLIVQKSLLPYRNYWEQTKVDYGLGESLESMWNLQEFNLNPADTTPCSYTEFYTKWIGEIATLGSVYESTAKSLEGTQEQIEASRQGVIGVSSDEELTSMIKYQQAYNAASRYINVVNEMIEHLLNSLGS